MEAKTWVGHSWSLVVAPTSLSLPSASASHPEAQSSQPRGVTRAFIMKQKIEMGSFHSFGRFANHLQLLDLIL